MITNNVSRVYGGGGEMYYIYVYVYVSNLTSFLRTKIVHVRSSSRHSMDKDKKQTRSRTSIKDTSLNDFSCYIFCKASMIKCIYDNAFKNSNYFFDILNKLLFS